MSKKDTFDLFWEKKKTKRQVDLYSFLRKKGKQEDNWRRRDTERGREKHPLLPRHQQKCRLSWTSDSLHLWGTTLPACTQPPCTPLQPPTQPQRISSSTGGGWLQPRPRWSFQPCRSQTLWASLTPPWITTQSWRRWWCSALRGPPSSPPPHPKGQALARGSQETSTTTSLEVRAGAFSSDSLYCIYRWTTQEKLNSCRSTLNQD